MDQSREWLFIVSNITVIIVGIKLLIAIGKVQNQVDTMWDWFTKHIDIR